MAASRLISTLKNGALSANAKVLTDPKSSEFEKSMERWTDLDKQMPYAIVMPATEDDIVKSVSLNLNHVSVRDTCGGRADNAIVYSSR